MIPSRFLSALAVISSIASALPLNEISLEARQEQSNCTEYSSGSAGQVCLFRPSDCTETYMVQSGDTCNSIVAQYNTFTFSILRYWNPDIGQTCFGLRAYTPLCISTPWYTFTAPAQHPDSTVLETDNLNPTELPVPVMPSIVAECNKYFLAGSGQRVDTISGLVGESIEDILDWNPAIDRTAATPSTWAGYWLCVGVSA